MGAGEFPAGIGPAGFDPPAAASIPNANVPPLAAKLDLATRTFPFTSDGRVQAVHPVDQAVNLALGTQRGSIASVPDMGINFARLRRVAPANLQTEVEIEVRATLARLLTNGDIELRSVVATRPIPGRVYVAVNYVNLRLAGATLTPAGFGL